jgi:hypothetical protein
MLFYRRFALEITFSCCSIRYVICVALWLQEKGDMGKNFKKPQHFNYKMKLEKKTNYIYKN